ncbi:carbon-nitrogen hydrolase family protein [Nocardioides daejeonensis]|uniref:carbon-nitrogen hydrolase family protein n=1 Tax=Nocardioides daejeonensis TaxID=1046556 RepID=UPI000D742F77|nr:carbon-nitrogen hydrolase family protein [Nocardioides daejeonensis]
MTAEGLRPLRVAAGQAATVCGDVAANVAAAVGLAHTAAARGARLLVLPEAFLTGYCPEAFTGPVPEAERLGDDLAPLAHAAAETGCTVVVSTPLRRGERRTLSSVVVSPDGAISPLYDKQHLSGYESDYFVAGEGGASIVVEGWELALGICYDASFPEHARAAALDGAQAYLVSAAFFPGGAERRNLYCAARALDNGMYVVFAGLVGSCGPERFIGGSGIYDPLGGLVARIEEEPGVVVADLDPDVIARTRVDHPMLVDRRVDLGLRRVHRSSTSPLS